MNRFREDEMLLARPETKEMLKLYDERGRPLGSVTLPTDPRLFGPEKATVFLDRTPPRPASSGPAQAA